MKKRYDFGRFSTILLCIVGVFVFLGTFVLAVVEPQGPNTITNAGSGRFLNSSGSIRIDAEAGNVTALVIDQRRSTQAWQGYYGNVTGTITLDDGNNQTLYDWSLPNPTGEIYASNDSIVTWNKVYCMNVSSISINKTYNGIVYSINGSDIELNFGINATDKDGLNETFNSTYTDTTGFSVGGTLINNVDGCSMANPYTDEASSSAWQELLLSDNTSLVFTALVRGDADAYKTGTEPADFQMLVLEDGHVGSETATTPYYFFVELA